MTGDIPQDLHELQYGRNILEEVLGWPAKSNLEMMADCLRSIAISRKLKPVQSYKYILRAIRLAKQQGITVDRFFFMEGKYTEVRPEKPNGLPFYSPIDREALDREQATPEWQAANAQLRATLAKLAGRTLSKSTVACLAPILACCATPRRGFGRVRQSPTPRCY